MIVTTTYFSFHRSIWFNTTKCFYVRVITKSILLLVYTLFRDDALFENFTCAAMYGHLSTPELYDVSRPIRSHSPGPFHYGPPQLLHAWSRTLALPYRSTQLNGLPRSLFMHGAYLLDHPLELSFSDLCIYYFLPSWRLRLDW